MIIVRTPLLVLILLVISWTTLGQNTYIGKEKLYYGVAYYPEAWDFETIEEDIQLMKKAHINVVRIGEFSWSLMEPEEGRFEFSWLHDLIDQLNNAGIEVIVGTPTATPPIWLVTKHPDIFQERTDGTLKGHGSRRNVKYNHPIYNEYCRIICEQLAKSLAGKKGVIAWQTDNEFNLAPDCSDLTKRDWSIWLNERYGSIENLNRIWVTNLWSQKYEHFDQIPMDDERIWHHPSLRTDWRKFLSDQVVAFQDIQIKAIRKYSDLPITHDGTPGNEIEYPELFENLDFTATNFYHNFSVYNRVQINFDRIRGYHKGKHWVFETAPNFSGGGPRGQNWYIHQPKGSLRAIIWSNYALGGQGTLFWLWRQHPAGHEMPHGSFISSWGKPVANFDKLCDLGSEINSFSDELMNSEIVPAEIGFLYSHSSIRGYNVEMNSGEEIDYYPDVTSKFYRPLSDAFLPRDVINEKTDLSQYKMLVIPMVPNIASNMKKDIREWVEGGGILILGPMSGFRSDYWTSFTNHSLGDFGVWTGISVDTRIPIDAYNKDHAEIPKLKYNLSDSSSNISLWSEALSSPKGKIIAEYTNSIHKGKPAIIENKVGMGKVVYLGTDPGVEIMKELYIKYADELGIKPLAKGDKDVLVVARRSGKKEYRFIINISNSEKKIMLSDQLKTNLFTGDQITDGVQQLEPFDVIFSEIK